MNIELQSQKKFLEPDEMRKSFQSNQDEMSKFKKKRCHYGLKQKLILWILLPLIICVVLTVLSSFLLIFYIYPVYLDLSGIFKINFE